MAVYFPTQSPQGLLTLFNNAIKDSSIKTWERHQDGVHYTHKAKEWHQLAWFLAAVEQGRLAFYIIKPQDKPVSRLVYAYYHGHLIETFINHFSQSIDGAHATPNAVSGDHVA